MSRRSMKIPLNFEAESQSVKMIEGVIADFKTAAASALSDKSLAILDLLESKVEQVRSSLTELQNVAIGEKDFNKLSKNISGLIKEVDKALIGFAADISSTSEAKLINDLKLQKEAIENEIEDLKSILQTLPGSSASRKAAERADFQERAQRSQTFSGFDGSSGSLGIEGMKSNLVNVQAILSELNRIDKVYQDLVAKGKNLTAGEAKTRDELAKQNRERATLRRMLNNTVDAVDKKAKKHEDTTKQLEKEEESLSKITEEIRQALELNKENNEVLEARTRLTEAETVRVKGETKGQEAFSSERAEREKEIERDENRLFSSSDIDEFIGKFFTLNALINATKRAISETLRVISDLDKAFVGIGVVTQYSNEEVWSMYDGFKRIAQLSGFNVAEIGQVAGEYFRQGESYSNVMLLTEAAAMAAKVAGIDAAESVRYLTSAIRGYNLAATDAMDISDKFAALAAATATDYDGMATAMSKVAAQAYSSGVEFDNLMGMMATAMDVTQEAPENIGTAFKTIFARMSEIKDFGATLEDGIDANRVEKALKTVNVELFNVNNEMRGLDQVLLEVGAQWDKLTQTQKAYLATALAGTRQQTRLLAVFENFDMTLKNIEVSRNSAGATEAQQIKNMEGLEHALNQVSVAYESVVTTVVDNRMVVGIVNSFAEGINTLVDILNTSLGRVAAFGGGITALFVVIRGILATQSMGKFVNIIKDIGISAWASAVDFKISASEFVQSAKKIVASGKNILQTEGVFATVSAGAKGLTASLTTLWSALWPYAAAAAIVGGIVFITKAFRDAKNMVEDTTKEISRLRAEMYNLNESRSTVKDLVDEYNTLERQIYKTNEELERQKEILQLLSDLDIEGDYNFSLDGKLDMSQVDKYLEQIRKERAENMLDSQIEGRKLYSIPNTTTSKGGTALSDASRALAIDALMGRRDTAKAVADFAGIKGMEKEVYNRSFDIDAFDELDQTLLSLLTKLIEVDLAAAEAFSDEELREGIQAIKEVDELLSEGTLNVGELKKELDRLPESLREQYKEINGLANTIDSWNGSMEVSGKALSEVNDALKIMENFDFSPTEQSISRMVQAFEVGGAEGFLEKMASEADKAGVGFGDLTRMTLVMIDALDEMSQDALLNALTTFDSIDDRINNLNSSMDKFNNESLKNLLDMISDYPQHAEEMMNSIWETGVINETVQKKILEDQKKARIENIKDEIAQNETRIALLEQMLKIAQAALDDEVMLEELASDGRLDISALTAEGIMNHIDLLGHAYRDMFDEIVKLSLDAGKGIEGNLTGEGPTLGISSYKGGDGGKFVKGSEEYKNRMRVITSTLRNSIDSYSDEINVLKNTNEALRYSLEAIDKDVWNKSKEGIEKTGKAAKEAAENIEIYNGALNKMYVAQKRLETVNWGLELIKTQRGYEQTAVAAEKLLGVQTKLRKGSVADTMNDEYSSLELYKGELENIISVTEEYREKLQRDLHPSLSNTYKIINGRIIPVSARYKKLTGEQMKEVDEFAAAFNSLTSDMHKYQLELINTEKAQNDLLTSMRDTVIEYQELLLGAIKNEEKKHIESFKKIIDANKKYIEERKKLYEETFLEEDNEKELEEVQNQRQKVIEKLAALESAHDITSVQRKEEYRKELQTLDDHYNELMLQRNRDALLKSLENQIQYQEEIYQKEEDSYNSRVESAQWLEERVKQIQDDARINAILDLEGHNLTIQKMLDWGYITQEEITKAGITDLNTTISDLSNEQLNIFKTYWGSNRDIIDDMWNNSESGTVALSEKAMDYILEYLTTHSTEMEGKTSLMREKIQSEWKGLMKQVSEYTKSFNAITLKGPNTSAVTNALTKMLNEIKTTVKGVELEYNKIIAAANKANNAVSNTSGGGSGSGGGGGGNPVKITYRYGTVDGKGNPNATVDNQTSAINQWGSVNHIYKFKYENGKYVSKTRVHTAGKKATGGSGIGLGTVAAFATGGTTERTGLHWLDGKPGAPERVLSPGANKRFEALLEELTFESKSRVQGGANSVASEEMLEALRLVSEAIYEAEGESAERIVNAIRDIPSSGGSSILDIANKKGITINQRRDK